MTIGAALLGLLVLGLRPRAEPAKPKHPTLLMQCLACGSQEFER